MGVRGAGDGEAGSRVRASLARAGHSIASALPRGRTLPEEAWRRRHHALLTLLWLHAVGLTIFAFFRGYSIEHSLLHGAGPAAFAAMATMMGGNRRAASIAVSLGLITSSALLVHSWGGVIEAHFHFFVMIALLSLYEDWLPFLLAAAYVVVHHGMAGAFDSHAVYNHADAQAHPWKWAGIHGLFVVGAGLASVIAWRLNEDVRAAGRKTEKQLREAQRMARLGSWESDLRTDEVTWSDELYRIFERDPQNWTPSSEGFRNHVDPQHRERIDQIVQSSRDSATGFSFETPIHTSRGHERLIDVHGDVIVDGRGIPTRMLGTVQDVTERRRVEEELQRQRQAEQEYRDRSDFLSRVSHELRTPLNAILGFSQLMEMEELTEEQRSHVDQISKGGRHLLQLINEVLDITRIEGGNMKVSVEPVSLNRVVDEVLRLLEPLADARAITLHNKLPAEQHYAQADNQRLKQVLLNLVSNAIKYNRDGGSVFIRLEQPAPDHIALLVTDSGRGITEEQLAKIFNPFERLEAAQDRIEGTGLGLTVSRLLVEAMGGTLSVASEREVGSTFTVALESARVLDPADTGEFEIAADLSPGTDNGRSISVLYVEDNVSNFQLVERIFAQRPEISLFTTMDGSLALDLAREHRPDVILLDLHLPGMDGVKVLQRLKADATTRDIPIVVVSADATDGQISRLRKDGAHDYLTKPIEVRSFLATIDDALATRSIA
jgi:signal transduction histidine kinase/ActR/RegA family two-component response regulator